MTDEFFFVRKTRIWISNLAVKAISLSVIFRECNHDWNHMKDLKASQPVDHHGGELPVANDLIVLIRLFHATRDELQFLENCVKFLLHTAERQRCRSLLDCRRSGRQWCTVRRPTVKDHVNYYSRRCLIIGLSSVDRNFDCRRIWENAISQNQIVRYITVVYKLLK